MKLVQTVSLNLPTNLSKHMKQELSHQVKGKGRKGKGESMLSCDNDRIPLCKSVRSGVRRGWRPHGLRGCNGKRGGSASRGQSGEANIWPSPSHSCAARQGHPRHRCSNFFPSYQNCVDSSVVNPILARCAVPATAYDGAPSSLPNKFSQLKCTQSSLSAALPPLLPTVEHLGSVAL